MSKLNIISQLRCTVILHFPLFTISFSKKLYSLTFFFPFLPSIPPREKKKRRNPVLLLLSIASQRAGLTSGPCALSGQSQASATTRVWFYLGTFEKYFGRSGCVRRAREHRKPKRGNCVHRVWARISELQAAGTEPPDRVRRSSRTGPVPAGSSTLGKGTERPKKKKKSHRDRAHWFYFCIRRLLLGPGDSAESWAPGHGLCRWHSAGFPSPPLAPAWDAPAPTLSDGGGNWTPTPFCILQPL